MRERIWAVSLSPPTGEKTGDFPPVFIQFHAPSAGHKKTPQVCVTYGVPRQMAGLYSVVPLNFENLLLVLLHPQPILKRFSGNADHVSNPDRLKLAGVCELIGRGFSNAENSGDVLHGVGPVFRRLLSSLCTHNLPPVSCRHFAHTCPVSLMGKALSDTIPAKNLLI